MLLLSLMTSLALASSPIVSTSPSNTELLYALGLGHRLVATSSFSEHPPQARNLPTLGPLFMPSLERTLSFRPQLAVVDAFTTPPSYVDGMRTLGIETMMLKIGNVESLYAESRKLGERLGEKAPAQSLLAHERCLATVSQGRPWAQKTFLAFAWADPPILFGPTTLISDIAVRLGGKNGSPRRGGDYPQVAEEWLLLHPPELVFYLVENAEQAMVANAKFDGWWPDTKQIRVALPSEFFGRASLTPVRESWRMARFSAAPRECEFR